MPICPDCSQYSADFSLGRLDPQDGTWYCSSCWVRFDQEEKKDRLKLGYVLPEDRSLWYSPGSVLTASSSRSETSSWCHEGPLALEVLDPAEIGKPNSWRLDLVDDFLVCGQSLSSSLLLFGESLPIVAITDLSLAPLDGRHATARKFVKISRQERKLLRSIESRAKARAAAEVEAKKRELLELAKRRAQLKKKPGKLQLVKKKIELWKSDHADLIKSLTRRPPGLIHDPFASSDGEPPLKRKRLDTSS